MEEGEEVLACKEGLFVAQREWRLMLTLGWIESVSGIAIEYQNGIEVEWSEKEDESGEEPVISQTVSIIYISFSPIAP